MRQFRIAVVVGVGILVLCGIALASTLMDYVSHPEVANAHVAPVVVTPDQQATATTAAAPAPLPTTPVTSVPVQQQPFAQLPDAQQPAASAPKQSSSGQGPAASKSQRDALDRFIQQLNQRRHRPPHQVP